MTEPTKGAVVDGWREPSAARCGGMAVGRTQSYSHGPLRLSLSDYEAIELRHQRTGTLLTHSGRSSSDSAQGEGGESSGGR